MQNTTWFENWFNTPYYHLLYKKRNDKEAADFITNITKKLALKPHSKILDAACGRGRHAITMHELGYDVTGIDIAEQNIEFANKYAEAGLEFMVHDMRNLLYTNYFDVVSNLFTSLGYFDSARGDARAIETFAKALKPKGLLIIDFFNAHKVIKNFSSTPIHLEVEGIKFTTQKEILNNHIYKHIEVNDMGKMYHFKESVRLMMDTDFEAYFEANNLNLLHAYGDYGLNAFDKEKSDRLILVAQKG